jgi:predicted ATPase
VLAAEASFRRAVDVAHRQGARALELCAATSLARLWKDQGRHAEARELLSPTIDWFAEGSDTPTVTAAKALLRELVRDPA